MTIVDEEIKTLAKQLYVRRHHKRYVGDEETIRAVREAATNAYNDARVAVETINDLHAERVAARTRRQAEQTRAIMGGANVHNGDGDAD